MTPTIGSLFSGYGGLDLAAAQAFGATVAWHVEYDAAPSKILAHHWPDVPNYGDVTTCDWASMPPVDILTGGYPCQPFSAAGQRKGTNDERHLWPYVREAIRHLRPRFTVLENVAGHRSLGLDRVLGDLAEDGLHVRWTSIRASDVGAPHHRERVFILVTPTDAEGERSGERLEPQLGRIPATTGRGGPHAGHSTPTDADSFGRRQGAEQPGAGTPQVAATGRGDGPLPADRRAAPVLDLLPTPAACNPNDGEGTETWLARREAVKARVKNGNGMGMPLTIAVQLLPTPNASDGSGSGQHPDKRVGHSRQLIDHALEANTPAWGKYAPAIHRWEHATRPAPAPTEPNSNGKPRLAAPFAEWMMGLPAGHVTDPAIGISRADQLKAVGNGVCPQQAIAALSQLVDMPLLATVTG